MSDSDRKVFPVESVLALVVGKEGVDIKDIAGYVVGRSIACDCCAKAVGPFAAAWLARWYPKFMDLTWSEDQSWEGFVTRGRGMLGDNVSLTPMDGRTKALAGQTLDYLADTFAVCPRRPPPWSSWKSACVNWNPPRPAPRRSRKNATSWKPRSRP